ncbi:MAG: alpha/beta fold hydrolase [Desulfobacterales bacterium]|nr:alpha/beta fold hydrolase [Desulfobacterales bacterium]
MTMNKGKPVDIEPFRDLYPFESNYLDRNGLRYHYVDQGHGDPVLMLHGNPTWSFYFRHLITGLSAGCRTVAPDHMGCGLSDKPPLNRYDYRLQSRVDDVTALMAHVNPDRPITLVVHDWGGMIGMTWALENLDRIGRIVITNTAGFLPPGKKPIPWRLRVIRSLTPIAVPAVLGFNLFSAAAVYMAPKRRLSAKVRAGLTAPYNCPANRMATLKFVQDIPLVPQDPSYGIVRRTDDGLHRLSHIPMLICWGKHDFVFDLDYYDEWRRRFPLAEAHLFENAGHYLLEDEPEAVLATIADFFNRHPVR